MSGYARLLVGDRFGRVLGEVTGDLGPVSWVLGGVGKLTFNMPMALATEQIYRYSNRVLVQFDNGLPAWGGIIDPPREWDGGLVTATAYSAEYLLGTRQTDKGRYFSGAGVGYIFRALIEETNAIEDTGISVGQVWGGGEAHYPDYHLDGLLDNIIKTSLCGRLSTADWGITAQESGGVISFTANLWERRGSDKPGIALIEGKNLTHIKRTENGPIVNWFDAAGSGSDWGDARLIGHAENTASRSKYGLRQAAGVYSSVSIQATLDAHASNALSDGLSALELTAIDLEPGLFAQYDLGDSLRVQAPSFGFAGGLDGMVRILGREYTPATGQCKLVVEVIE